MILKNVKVEQPTTHMKKVDDLEVIYTDDSLTFMVRGVAIHLTSEQAEVLYKYLNDRVE